MLILKSPLVQVELTPQYQTWISIGATVVATAPDFDEMSVQKRKCFLDNEDPFKDDPIRIYDVSIVTVHYILRSWSTTTLITLLCNKVL